MARVGRGGVIMIAVFMALLQLGVAPNIVTTAFAILFGAVAFALALSFGLGNRELAGEVTRAWYERYRSEKEALEREAAEAEAADLAEDEAAERAAAERASTARRTPRWVPTMSATPDAEPTGGTTGGLGPSGAEGPQPTPRES
jgi:hypothetical protein